MRTIRIPSETCLETAVPQMQAFWIRIRQRSQPLPGRGRIVGGSSHSCHYPLAISTVLPELMTYCGKVISREVCTVGMSWVLHAATRGVSREQIEHEILNSHERTAKDERLHNLWTKSSTSENSVRCVRHEVP